MWGGREGWDKSDPSIPSDSDPNNRGANGCAAERRRLAPSQPFRARTVAACASAARPSLDIDARHVLIGSLALPPGGTARPRAPPPLPWPRRFQILNRAKDPMAQMGRPRLGSAGGGPAGTAVPMSGKDKLDYFKDNIQTQEDQVCSLRGGAPHARTRPRCASRCLREASTSERVATARRRAPDPAVSDPTCHPDGSEIVVGCASAMPAPVYKALR